MKSLRAVLAVLLLLTMFAAQSNERASLTERFKQQGFIVPEDQIDKPTEIRKESVGRTIVCLNKDLKKVTIYAVQPLMFKKGQYSIFALCVDGQLFIKDGYI